MSKPRCLRCGKPMTTRRENAPYTGLPGTVLIGVSVSRCSDCGEHEVAIPAILELDRALAGLVLRKPARLVGAEIRYLRMLLQYSAARLAKLIGSEPATLSRWESDKQSIGCHADLLLRTMVALHRQLDFSLHEFPDVTTITTDPPSYALKPHRGSWIPTKRIP